MKVSVCRCKLHRPIHFLNVGRHSDSVGTEPEKYVCNVWVHGGADKQSVINANASGGLGRGVEDDSQLRRSAAVFRDSVHQKVV